MQKKKISIDEKKEMIKKISDDIINNENFIYESENTLIMHAQGHEILSFITIAMKTCKDKGASNNSLKQCYEIAIRDETEAIKYMLDKIKNTINNNDE